MQHDYDFIIVGSGFGGSVAALRLSEKGYKVLVVEKGKRWAPEQFPETNWNLKKWMWLPLFRFHGFFKMTIMQHVGILSGVGVGGGSLVYANTLPRPEDSFFESGSWSGLAEWKNELEPHYREAERMLGVVENPGLYDSDEALRKVASQYGKSDRFEATRVAVYFGEAEQEVPDPYFDGAGPRRSGCNFCGSCMTGCRYNAKNTLDKNYLYLAAKNGVQVAAGKKVTRLQAIEGGEGKGGYTVSIKESLSIFKRKSKLTSGGVIMAGGVLGTVRLLLDMKPRYMKGISELIGSQIRTNNESLVLVHSMQKEKDFSKGIAIGSIFPADKDTHLEAVRYGSGSGFWKMLGVPLTHGKTVVGRILKLIWKLITNPVPWLRIYFSKNFAKELAEAGSRVVNGTPFVMSTEALTGTPTTAHILGGCVIGADPDKGVIDYKQRVFGYQNLYVCDGSAISANPGVNPALTITAMTERVMSKIPHKK